MGLFFRDYTPVQIRNTFGSPLVVPLELPKGSRLKFWKIFVNRHINEKSPALPPWGHLRVHLRDTTGVVRLCTH